MLITRRDLLKAGALVATATTIPRPLLAYIEAKPEPVPPIDDPRLKALVARALEAAHAAGATYADVRLTHTRQLTFQGRPMAQFEGLDGGVRALVDGYWGFATSPVWSPDELARLGREAVHQAKANALGKPRAIELAPVPAVPDGHWVMPVKADPFAVPTAEILDFMRAVEIYTHRTPGAAVKQFRVSCFRQDSAFGSTVGSYVTQRRWRTAGTLVLVLEKHGKKGELGVDLLTPAGAGWEYVHEAPLKDAIRNTLAEIEADLTLPVKPVEVGRYDTVFDARSVAGLLHDTLGPATELDRVLGYEANAGGTSYLSDPVAMLGTYRTGAELLTVTGNRSEPGGCATVRWDDEGVTPDEFTLVKDGVLTDFQTTRESAGWLKEAYAKAGRPLRSHGCALAPSGTYAPLQHAPNLVLASGKETLDFDGLVAGLPDGIAIKGASVDMDFQHLDGLGMGRTYEVKRGKRVARIAGAAFLFRAPELWKGLLTLGGTASARRYGLSASKGEPMQQSYASMTAPPAVFKALTVIDPLRKA
jgi:TldD protein